MNIKNKIETFNELFTEMENIILSDSENFKLKYNLIFSKNISDPISDLLRELNIKLSYYDPDSSYKEDVMAFYEAIKDIKEELELINV